MAAGVVSSKLHETMLRNIAGCYFLRFNFSSRTYSSDWMRNGLCSFYSFSTLASPYGLQSPFSMKHPLCLLATRNTFLTFWFLSPFLTPSHPLLGACFLILIQFAFVNYYSLLQSNLVFDPTRFLLLAIINHSIVYICSKYSRVSPFFTRSMNSLKASLTTPATDPR